MVVMKEIFDGPCDGLLISHHMRARKRVEQARNGFLIERPSCRNLITKGNWTPHFYAGAWTGYPKGTGQAMFLISKELQLQMAIMIAEGCFDLPEKTMRGKG